jgi:tellurite resistance protein TerC
MSMHATFLWASLPLIVVVVLILDLFVISKKNEIIPARKALMLTGFFVLLGLLYSGVVYLAFDSNWFPDAKTFSGQPMTGAAAWGEYISVWLTEYSMSVDNLFVFTVIFSSFAIPPKYQHRVLLWGILGALILRAIMITVGAELVQNFEPILIFFGLILVWTAYKMLTSGDSHADPNNNIALKIAKKIFPVTTHLHGERFFVRCTTEQAASDAHLADEEHKGKKPVAEVAPTLVPIGHPAGKLLLHATPLFLVLCVVEATDVIFAVDSVPAAFGSSKTPFIVFSANVFAILGLRALYFAISSMIRAFAYLKYALVLVLVGIGIKLMLTPKLTFIKLGTNPDGTTKIWEGMHLPGWISPTFIAVCIVGGIAASLLLAPKEQPAHQGPAA